MAVNKWIIVDASTLILKNRYLLKVNGSRDDILNIFNLFFNECEVPFALKDDKEFTWGLYYYDADGKISDKILKKFSAKETAQSPGPKQNTYSGSDSQKEPPKSAEVSNYFFEMMYPDFTKQSQNRPDPDTRGKIAKEETKPELNTDTPAGTVDPASAGEVQSGYTENPDELDPPQEKIARKSTDNDILNGDIKGLITELNDILGNLTTSEKEKIKGVIETNWKDKIAGLKNRQAENLSRLSAFDNPEEQAPLKKDSAGEEIKPPAIPLEPETRFEPKLELNNTYGDIPVEKISDSEMLVEHYAEPKNEVKAEPAADPKDEPEVKAEIKFEPAKYFKQEQELVIEPKHQEPQPEYPSIKNIQGGQADIDLQDRAELNAKLGQKPQKPADEILNSNIDINSEVDVPEEPKVKKPEPLIVETPPPTKPQPIPDALKQQILVAVVYEKNTQDLLTVFESNINDVVQKTTKGAFNSEVLLKYPIDNSSPDLGGFFAKMDGAKYDLIVLIDSPDLPRMLVAEFTAKMGELKKYFKIISKASITKRFIYLDLVVDVMLKKKGSGTGK